MATPKHLHMLLVGQITAMVQGLDPDVLKAILESPAAEAPWEIYLQMTRDVLAFRAAVDANFAKNRRDAVAIQTAEAVSRPSSGEVDA